MDKEYFLSRLQQDGEHPLQLMDRDGESMNSGRKTITLTGATGFLGSHLMTMLLKRGYRVNVPGRPGSHKSLLERITNLLNWFSIDHLADRVAVFETDFGKPQLGLNHEDYKRLCADACPIIHCASDTSFAERNRERVFKANVQSLEGICELARNSRASYFHYIGTAYATGILDGPVHELPSDAVVFTNVYEESKAAAEKKISRYCEKYAIPYTLIRPSIVYGDASTGRSLKFNALYYPVKSVQYIRDIYINDIRNNGGMKSTEYGIFMDKDGYLNLPIRVYLPWKGSINLIPVDYFTNAAISVIENPFPGKIYHLTSETPSTMETLLSYTGRFLKVKGMDVSYLVPDESMLRNPPEELIDHFIEPYRPYLSDRRVFERSNTAEVTGGILPAELSYEIFERCMGYAMSVEWGRLFKEF